MGKTPLSQAVGKADVETVRTLLQYGARPSFTDTLNWGHYANSVLDDELSIAKMCILHGAKANLYGDLRCLDQWWDLLVNPRGNDRNIKWCTDLLRLMITENVVVIPKEQPCVLTLKNLDTIAYRLLRPGCRGPLYFMKVPNIWIIPYFYELGFRISQIDTIVDDKSLHSELCPNTLKIIDELKRLRFPDLKSLARKCIRREIGSPLSSRIVSLPIPEVIKDYIKMADVMEES